MRGRARCRQNPSQGRRVAPFMITSVFKYAYPNAKVRAMKGMLVPASVYHALIHAETFGEVLHVLQTTDYAEVFSDQMSPDMTLPELTGGLYKSLFTDYGKIIRSVSRDIRTLLILLYQQYELINLKTILRGIITHIPSERIARLLLPTEHHLLFSKADLLQFREVHDVIEHLQGSFFQYPLNLAVRRFQEEQEFFPLEMALDLHYYQTLWETAKKLSDLERRVAQQILGMYVDILNIAWIVRFKEQYHFSPEEILNYTIHHGYALTLDERRGLAQAETTAQILTDLQETPYGKALTGEEPLPTLHIVLTRYFIQQLHKFFAGNPFQIGVILSYLFLKEFEISDILSIAEAKKSGFSAERSQQYVIHATP
ncbi:hypothetical protein GF339_11905 [candidate division KSB3 bacterium]|uniref:V-type ATP synthase subunit C n=1 Tax=candidate division KSB3 bacterium TaxID=2044937 RepID=A0A9D5JW09_9BACT|nr:hypothetical protein [candidate division KSB3 bacterium]MBD3325283.1 hypothetical protein [candidate division KSB3 bacterium]